jgi:DNA-binding NarL/FixJ family response regulator
MHDSDQYILHMMEIGVHAFLLKNTEPEELEKAICSVTKKDFYHNDLVASVLRKNVIEKKSAVRPKFNPVELTEREREIMTLVCREMSNKEIGSKLGLSERTIENHRFRLMEKLNLKSVVGLVRFAYENGFIE